MNEDDKLRKASDLIKAKQFHEARDILESIAHHPTAQKWLARLDEIAPQSKRKHEEDDPFGGIGDDYGGDYGDDYPATKSKPLPPHKDYTGTALLIFFLYWVLWFPGLVANFYYINDAKEYQRYWGIKPTGVGCLWIVLMVNLLPILACCGLILAVVLIGPETGQIFENILSTLDVTAAPR